LWVELWATPQAWAWDRLGYVRMVARYARKVLEAERPDSGTALLAEVRQMEDRLGLTPLSMLRLEWRVADGLVASGPTGVVVTPDRWRREPAG
jgi:hypothetical protein